MHALLEPLFSKFGNFCVSCLSHADKAYDVDSIVPSDVSQVLYVLFCIFCLVYFVYDFIMSK